MTLQKRLTEVFKDCAKDKAAIDLIMLTFLTSKVHYEYSLAFEGFEKAIPDKSLCAAIKEARKASQKLNTKIEKILVTQGMNKNDIQNPQGELQERLYLFMESLEEKYKNKEI
jgi:hypothetical protein